MHGNHDAVTCHWLTPTRVMPHPYSLDAENKPWTCLRDGVPRALTGDEVARCAGCPRWEARTIDDVQLISRSKPGASASRFPSGGRSTTRDARWRGRRSACSSTRASSQVLSVGSVTARSRFEPVR